MTPPFSILMTYIQGCEMPFFFKKILHGAGGLWNPAVIEADHLAHWVSATRRSSGSCLGIAVAIGVNQMPQNSWKYLLIFEWNIYLVYHFCKILLLVCECHGFYLELNL